MKKPFILYSKFSSPTGKALCEALGWPGGKDVKDISEISHLVRWGCTQHSDIDLSLRRKDVPVSNRSEYVREVVNREHMFRSISNLGAARHHRLRHTQGMMLEPGYMARHRFGRWGKDIVEMSDVSREEFGIANWDGYFLVEKWLADFEVRVHIVGGNSVSFQIKYRKDEDGAPVRDQNPTDAGKLVVRNDRNGWHLYPLSHTEARRLGIQKDPIRDVAKGILTGLGLDFGCVDFLVRVPTGAYGTVHDFRILEVNSSPGLDGSTLDAYASALQKFVENYKARPEDGFDDDDEDDFDDDPDDVRIMFDNEDVVPVVRLAQQQVALPDLGAAFGRRLFEGF